MRTPACESDEVSKRLAELRAESAALLNCTCRRSDDGKTIEGAAICPLHRPSMDDSMYCGLALPWRILP